MVGITPDMRQILVDWLVDVHQSFELKEQTLYLALIYLNQYASQHEITKHEYQLVGISCLWIASKYEEIYPPSVRQMLKVAANETIKKEDVLDMEYKMRFSAV